jgi:hypothetical protein
MLRNRSSLCKVLALAALVTSLALTVASEVAWEQQAGIGPLGTTQHAFKFTYFSNGRQALDGHVRIVNGGSNATSSGTNGDLCANVYVFFQEKMSECCGCLVTSDGGLQLSINKDLTNNPKTGAPLTKGVIKMISTVPKLVHGVEVCDPTFVFDPTNASACPGSGPGTNAPQCATPELGAWATHVQAQLPNQSFPESEAEFWPATLSTAEVDALNNECGAIGPGPSGKGVCSCGTSQ